MKTVVCDTNSPSNERTGNLSNLGTTYLPPANAALLRLNTICPYYTMFPLTFPFHRLKRAQPSEWVLDPFCGRGTTNFAARLRGLSSVGVDSNPVAAAIAAAKHVDVTPFQIIQLCSYILSNTTTPHEVPHDSFWETCFGCVFR